ncbi:hypothetical protein WSK_0757 [Novosphingobium sp. Rr 2-17]|nr:hypothetical protein WSK_0757 [Novosphingobium sp. Rr 2-17]
MKRLKSCERQIHDVIVFRLAAAMIDAEHALYLGIDDRDFLLELLQQRSLNAFALFDAAARQRPRLSVCVSNERYKIMLLKKYGSHANCSRLRNSPYQARRSSD